MINTLVARSFVACVLLRVCFAMLPVVTGGSLLLTCGPALAALTLGEFDAARHDRSTSPDFIGSDFDFSGVGNLVLGGNTNRWATLISPSYFVTAFHGIPQLNQSYQFFESNDFGGTTHTRTVISGARIGTTDLWLGKFEAPLPSSVAHYSIATGDPIGQDVFIVGRGTSGIRQRVGLNRVDLLLADYSATLNGIDTTTNIIGSTFDPLTGFGADEAIVEAEDSGGPTFFRHGDELLLGGTHAFRGSLMSPGGEMSPFTGDSWVGSYAAEIAGMMEGETPTFVNLSSVPEPAGLAAIALAGLCTAGAVRRFRPDRSVAG